MFCALTENRGASSANGLGYWPEPATNPGGEKSRGRPPSYSGIEPSALPAFSAPCIVKVVPSLLASSAGTAARAFIETANATTVVRPVRDPEKRLQDVFILFVYLFYFYEVVFTCTLCAGMAGSSL